MEERREEEEERETQGHPQASPSAPKGEDPIIQLWTPGAWSNVSHTVEAEEMFFQF